MTVLRPVGQGSVHKKGYLSLVFLSFILIGQTNSLLDLSCPDGWTRDGASCYKLFTVPLIWDDAVNMCKGYGSELVKVWGTTENHFVGNMTKTHGTSKYWIGMERDSGSVQWSDGTASDVNRGYWARSQPASGDGCVYVENNEMDFYVYGWNLGSCQEKMSFVCEAKTCIDGFFQCANGRCIKNGLCDGEDDCHDNSDETDCPDLCNKLLTGESGNIASSNPYDNAVDCQWTIKADPGQRVSLTFTNFITEKDLDEVQIWVGGPTTLSSRLLDRLSGNYNVDDIPVYASENNFMIIKFRSDKTENKSGFTADWTTSPVDSGITYLTATSTMQTFTSPNFPNGVTSGLRDEWIITAGKWMVITLEITEFQLGQGGYVQIRDGSEVTSTLLVELSGSETKRTVTSTSDSMRIYLYTDRETTNKGFSFKYWEGCNVDIVADSGFVMSPAYGVANYPDMQTCITTVTTPGGNDFRINFDSSFRIQEAKDRLKIIADDGSVLWDTFHNASFPPFSL